MAIENAAGLQIHPADDVVTLINIFTLKSGMLDAFCEAQIGEYRRLSDQVKGSLGANLHRKLEGDLAANYAQFTSMEAYRGWVDGPLFGPHLDVIKPYIEKVEPRLYRVSFTQRPAWREGRFEGVSENEGGAVLRVGQPVITLINRFTLKPGLLDAFCTAQIGEYRRLADQMPGAVSANLHRSIEGDVATNYAQFESLEAYRAWVDGPLFKPHLEVIKPYIEKAEPRLFELVFTLHEPGARLV